MVKHFKFDYLPTITKVNTRDSIGSKNRKMLQYMKDEGITGTRESLYPPDVLCECCYKIVDKSVIIVPLSPGPLLHWHWSHYKLEAFLPWSQNLY